MSNSLWPHCLQPSRLPCPSLSPGVCLNSCPFCWWCSHTISSSAAPFFFCLQSFPASGSNESALHLSWPKYWSFSYILENIIFRSWKIQQEWVGEILKSTVISTRNGGQVAGSGMGWIYTHKYTHTHTHTHTHLAYSLYKCMYCCCLVSKSCPALCDPLDCSPPGSSVYGISQARILGWVAISFFRGSSQPRDQTCAPCMASRFFTTDPPEKLHVCVYI